VQNSTESVLFNDTAQLCAIWLGLNPFWCAF